MLPDALPNLLCFARQLHEAAAADAPRTEAEGEGASHDGEGDSAAAAGVAPAAPPAPAAGRGGGAGVAEEDTLAWEQLHRDVAQGLSWLADPTTPTAAAADWQAPIDKKKPIR